MSELLRRKMSTYCHVYTDHEAIRAEIKNGLKTVFATNNLRPVGEREDEHVHGGPA